MIQKNRLFSTFLDSIIVIPFPNTFDRDKSEAKSVSGVRYFQNDPSFNDFSPFEQPPLSRTLSCVDLATCERLRSTYASRSIDNELRFRTVPFHPGFRVFGQSWRPGSIEKDELKLRRNEADERILEDKGG